MSQQRIKSFDVLKGMMIFLVILGHLSLFSYKSEAMSLPVIHKIFAEFHVPVFFFVAGMFFGIDKRNNFSEKSLFVLQKAVYLLLPSLFFYVLYNASHNLNPMAFIYFGFGKYWFLPTLFYAMFMVSVVDILSSLLSKNETNKRICGNVVLLLSLFCISYYVLFVNTGYKNGILQISNTTAYLPIFAAGYLCRIYKEQGEKVLKNQILITVAIVIVFVSIMLSRYRESIPETIYSLIYIIRVYFLTFICLSCFFHYQGRFEKNNWFNNFFALVGKYTLPIYVLHYFFLPDLAWLRKIMGDDSTVLVYLILIVIAVAIICLCLIFTKVISRSDFLGHYLLGQKSDRFKY